MAKGIWGETSCGEQAPHLQRERFRAEPLAGQPAASLRNAALEEPPIKRGLRPDSTCNSQLETRNYFPCASSVLIFSRYSLAL
jgi:hypothetical protein